MDTRGAVLLGSQTPTYEWVPPAWSSAGQDAVEMAAACGLIADPYQEHILEGGLGEEPDDRWTVNEVGVIVPRQNGKGFLIEARELSGLFVFGETLIMHSAHEFKTAARAFLRMKVIIESNPDLDRRLIRVSESKGQEGFTFRIDGKRAELLYVARTSGGGRGFEGCNLVVLDEAMILDDPPIAALLPTMATRSMGGQSWQVWYLGSAGDIRLRTQSVVLARVRRRGYRKEPGLALYEFAAHLRHDKTCPEDCVLDVRADPRTWAKTNPAFNRRIDESFLRKMMGSMAAWDFDREFLSVGEYPAEDGWELFDEDAWNGLKDPASRMGKMFAVGLETAWDGSTSSVSVTSWRPDGRLHLEMTDNKPGSAWLVDYAVALKRRRPVAFVADPKAPTKVVIADLKAAGVKVYEPTLNELSAWCAKMVQVVSETKQARHLGQATMDAAVKAATKRDVGQGAYVWERIDQAADVTPWWAGTLALGGLIRFGNRRGGKPLVASA